MRKVSVKQCLAMCLVLSVFSVVNAQKHVRMRQNGKNNIEKIEKSFQEYYKTHDSGKGSGYKQFQRWLYHEKFKETNGTRIVNSVSVWKEARGFRSAGLKSAQKAVTWTELGPNNFDNNTGSWNPGNGRINVIAFHPTNNKIIYVGAPAGGLWKTTTGGNSWVPLTDKLPLSGVSAIAIDPKSPNTIYIGTGDKDGSSSYSIGMLKSIDGGSTWNTTGLNWDVSSKDINELVVHPQNSNIVYAATSYGLLKSSNSGSSFTSLLSGSIEDIELKPNDPGTIYVTRSTSVYVSTNGGDTFSKTHTASSSARCLLSVSADAPNNVYLLSGDGFYKSTNKGSSFSKVSNLPFSTSTSWYMWALAVSPVNANEVHIGRMESYVSTNGGSSWRKSSVWQWGGPYVHADIHTFVFNSGTVYVGSDGGIFKSSNAGSTWLNLSKGLSIREFYRISTSKNSPNKILGGAQDNGTSVYTNGKWSDWLGADGMEGLIHHTNQNIVYGTSQNGTWYKSTNGGANRVSIAQPGTGSWVTPAVMHPGNSNTIFVGNVSVRKTTNGMGSWSSLASFGSSSSYIKALAISESNPNVLYGSKGTRLYKTTNGGSSWSNVSSKLPNQNISYITMDPKNSQNVAVSFSGFGSGEKVYLTTNGGGSWQNISKNLPNLPARCLTFDYKSKGGLYVGMEVGVYYKDNSMNEWISYFDNLPNCPISELEISEKAEKIRVATYGRGLWEAPLYNGGSVDIQSPYGGTPWAVPGTIEAEDFDEGGEAVAFHNTTNDNAKNTYRPEEDVEIEKCSEGGYDVSWITAGEWMEYTVDVKQSGEYILELRVASPNTKGKVMVKFNGSDKTGDIIVGTTGDNQKWKTISKTVNLSSGKQVMQVYFTAGGFNLNNIKLSKNIPVDNLPAPWTNADIGTATKGEATYKDGLFTIKGVGDIWGTADAFHFVSQSVSGDYAIIAKVESITNTDKWAEAGIMFRNTIDANSSFVMVLQRPDNSVCMMWRTATGANAEWSGSLVGGTAEPKYVKLIRSGNSFTGFYSIDGSSYTKIKSVTISAVNSIKVGMITTSQFNETIATAKISNVSVKSGVDNIDLPTPWTNTDIGTATKGEATHKDGLFTLKGVGDIWGTADAFHFVLQNVTGNKPITAKVLSITNTNKWAEAGVMYRSSLDANSSFAMVIQRPDNSVCMLWRASNGANAEWSGSLVGGTESPKFVKLVRDGNTFTGSYSLDGTNYTLIKTITVSIPNSAKIGLITTSYADGVLATAKFSNVRVGFSTPEYRPLPEAEMEENMEITVIPNAENELLEVYIKSDSECTKTNMGLYNMSGTLLKSAISDVRNPQLDLSGLNAGVYILSVQIGNERISKKFIKK